MDGGRTKEALLEFLDYLAEKGLMERATVLARKAAASQILSILDDDEAVDVTKVDLEDLISRFGRLHGKKYTPQSLSTYKSRLRSALDDFRSYLSNPLAFRPSVQARERKTRLARDTPSENLKAQAEIRTEPPRQSAAPMASSSILPIPIRADLTIYIQGLPFDLSEGEARKIAGVVTALAQS